MKPRGRISIAVVVLVLALLWWSTADAAAEKKRTASVDIGDYDVTFNPNGGEWNPYYVKRSSVELEEN